MFEGFLVYCFILATNYLNDIEGSMVGGWLVNSPKGFNYGDDNPHDNLGFECGFQWPSGR